MRDIKHFRWQSGGVQIEGRLNTGLRDRVLYARTQQCLDEGTGEVILVRSGHRLRLWKPTPTKWWTTERSA